MMRPSLLRFQIVPTARASALRLARPAPRCFSVMASAPRSEDECGPSRRPQLTSLKDLRASALRTRLAALPTVDTTADPAASRGFASAAQEIEVYTPAPILGRFCVSAEVVVSKIFPAGFGWQGSSCIADQAFQLKDTDTMFFVTTGIGDMVGVTLGATSSLHLPSTSF